MLQNLSITALQDATPDPPCKGAVSPDPSQRRISGFGRPRWVGGFRACAPRANREKHPRFGLLASGAQKRKCALRSPGSHGPCHAPKVHPIYQPAAASRELPPPNPPRPAKGCNPRSSGGGGPAESRSRLLLVPLPRFPARDRPPVRPAMRSSGLARDRRLKAALRARKTAGRKAPAYFSAACCSRWRRLSSMTFWASAAGISS